MPVLHHIGAGRSHQVYVLAQLPVVGRILRARIPANGLRVDFSHQVVGSFERAREVAAVTRSFTGVFVLRGVIGVHAHDVQVLRNLAFTDVGRASTRLN